MLCTGRQTLRSRVRLNSQAGWQKLTDACDDQRKDREIKYGTSLELCDDLIVPIQHGAVLPQPALQYAAATFFPVT